MHPQGQELVATTVVLARATVATVLGVAVAVAPSVASAISTPVVQAAAA
jgi:hypothetical protein